MIYNAFEALNLYGKKPESLKAVSSVFQQTLGEHCIADIQQAFALWIKRESKFPTPADINGLIERDGKPPFSDAMYVSLNKKDPYDRTSEDWEYIQEFESYKRSGGNNNITKMKENNAFLRKENRELKEQIVKLNTENDLLSNRIAFHEKKKQEIKTKPVNKIKNTVKFMREQGASNDDIKLFVDEETAKLINKTRE